MNIHTLIEKVKKTPAIYRMDYFITTEEHKNKLIGLLNEYSVLATDIPKTPEEFCDMMDKLHGELPEGQDGTWTANCQMQLYLTVRALASRC